MRRLFLVLSAIALLSAALLTSSRLENSRPAVSPESFIEDVRVVNRRTGQRQWTLLAKRAVFSDSRSASLSSVTVEIPSEQMTLRADRGNYETESGDLTLSGNINADTADYRIDLQPEGQMRLVAGQGEAHTTDEVAIEGAGFRITGKGMNITSDHVRLLDDVRAEFH